MSYRLFLDDERNPNEVKWSIMSLCDGSVVNPSEMFKISPWEVVRDYDSFVRVIEENGVPDLISYDHDLADEHYPIVTDGAIKYGNYKEKTGFHCAKWLIEHCIEGGIKLPKSYAHSMNPIGRDNILSLHSSYRRLGNE